MNATLHLEPTSLSDSGESQDRAAIQRTLADRDAFAFLYEKYVADVYRYCYRRLNDREAAEDVTSHIFMHAYSALPTLGSRPFRPWLFAIAHNAVIDAYRRRKPPTTPLDELANRHDGAATPEDQAIETEGVDAICSLFLQLTERDRQVVELRLAGLTGPEIAQVLHCSSTVVRTAQYRAFGKIRALLAQSEPALGKGPSH